MSEMIVQVRNKMLRRIGGVNHFVSHNKDYTIQFQFDESWNNVRTKMVVFAYEDGEYGSEIFDGDTCNVPEFPREGRILIGVKAGEDLSTELLCIPVCKSADDVITDEYDEPDPKIYEQILDIINNLWNGGTTVYPSPVRFLAAPSTAKVGDLIRVKEVDENGEIKETEAVDVEKELVVVNITKDADGVLHADMTYDEINPLRYTHAVYAKWASGMYPYSTSARMYFGEDLKNVFVFSSSMAGMENWRIAIAQDGSVKINSYELELVGRKVQTIDETTGTGDDSEKNYPSAKAVYDAIGQKIDKNQGTKNAGKILGIGADGNVTPQNKPAQALAGAAAPTTATAGVVGQEYYVIVNNAVTEMYVCTAVANGTYTWDKVEFGAEIDDTSTEPTKVWSAEKCNQLSEEIADCIKSPTTAEVGQIVKIAAVDDAGKPTAWEAVDLPEQVQADWDQNDSTAADYVKNRTHYTNRNTVLEYGVLSGFEDDGSGTYFYLLPYALDIYGGLKVKVTWDNQVYQLTAKQPTDGIAFIGNNLFLGGEDSGEPFGIVINKKLGTTSVISAGTEASHEVGIVVESPVRIEPYFLPSNIAYLQNGFIPLNLVIPSDIDVFGGVIVAGGTESTLENPYRNKRTLDNLTLETFNAMLDGTVYLPSCILIGKNNIASVSVYKNDGYIRVLWSSYITYALAGYTLAGARIEIYDAKIHEDAGNTGTIVSEYAIISVADKRLT